MEDLAQSKVEETEVVVKFAGRSAPYLFAFGCFLDALSTFLPWSEFSAQHWFLPYSIPLPLGWQVEFFSESVSFFLINVSVRAAVVLGVAGLFLLDRYKSKSTALSYFVLFVSMGLTFTAVAVFCQLGLPFFIGSYLVVVAGVLKVLTLILENLEIQIVRERTERETV